jgi:hypothetical protein
MVASPITPARALINAGAFAPVKLTAPSQGSKQLPSFLAQRQNSVTSRFPPTGVDDLALDTPGLGGVVSSLHLSDKIRSSVDWLAKLNILRIKICFYSASFITMGFGLFVVLNSFSANANIFKKCQLGKRDESTGGTLYYRSSSGQ